MRTTRSALTLLLVGLLGAAGCYESLTSIATPDKVVFYDDLIGDYKADADVGRVTLEKGEGKSYAFRQFDDKGGVKTRGVLRIVKLGDDHFYEFTADGFTTLDRKPVYAIGRLAIEGKAGARSLTGYQFQTKEQFYDAPKVTAVEYPHEQGGEKGKSRAASMPADKLQAYLAAHAREMTDRTLKLERTAAAH